MASFQNSMSLFHGYISLFGYNDRKKVFECHVSYVGIARADFDDETFQVARSMHAPVAENQMQFFMKKDVDNLIPIQKSFAQLLVISNVLNTINTQFRFDLVILNESNRWNASQCLCFKFIE